MTPSEEPAAIAVPVVKPIAAPPVSLLRALGAYTSREKQFLLSEMMQIKGLMPLLMKPRNRQRWSVEDKAELARHLKRLSQLSPYLFVVMLPGGLLMLPALAWWLDRRRNRHAPPLAR